MSIDTELLGWSGTCEMDVEYEGWVVDGQGYLVSSQGYLVSSQGFSTYCALE